MKKTIIAYALLFLTLSITQAQNVQRGFNFQGVALNQANAALVDASINIRITIYPQGDAANPVYTETHSLTSDSYGVFQIKIGSIDPTGFGNIAFSEIDCWMWVESRTGTDPYQTINNIEMPSTAYAKFADVALNGVPSGAIMPYMGAKANIPPGWLYCDGSSYPATGVYAKLFGVIAYAWGNTGDEFHVPDLRARFMRGVSDGAGTDPDAANRTAQTAGGNTGDNVGTQQNDDFTDHLHAVSISATSSSNGAHTHWYDNQESGEQTCSGSDTGPAQTLNTGVVATSTSGSHSHTIDVVGDTELVTGNETRPINLSVFYIIKM